MKKIYVFIVILLIILLVPVKYHLKDGGTVEYKAVLYKISKVHSLNLNLDGGYNEGVIVNFLGFEIYNNVVLSKYDELLIDGIALEIKPGSLTNSGATLIVTDSNSSKYIFDDKFTIEEKINGEWAEVKQIHSDYAFDDIEYSTDESREFNIDWSYIYGFLTGGPYRIRKEFSRDGIKKYASVGFSFSLKNDVVNQEMNIKLNVNNHDLLIKLEDNSSAKAFLEKLKSGSITVNASDYGNFEKVGVLGFSLPTNDKSITTKAGDLILYQGDKITLYYDKNTWTFTKLGEVQDVNQDELKKILGAGDVTLTFSINK